MDRNGFRNRMKQYKKAREENPGLKYWEWKSIPKYDEGTGNVTYDPIELRRNLQKVLNTTPEGEVNPFYNSLNDTYGTVNLPEVVITAPYTRKASLAQQAKRGAKAYYDAGKKAAPLLATIPLSAGILGTASTLGWGTAMDLVDIATNPTDPLSYVDKFDIATFKKVDPMSKNAKSVSDKIFVDDTRIAGSHTTKPRYLDYGTLSFEDNILNERPQWVKDAQEFYDTDVMTRERKAASTAGVFYSLPFTKKRSELTFNYERPVYIREYLDDVDFGGYANDKMIVIDKNSPFAPDETLVHEGAHFDQLGGKTLPFNLMANPDTKEVIANAMTNRYTDPKYRPFLLNVLDDAYEFTEDFGKTIHETLEKGATNREMRYNIWLKNNKPNVDELDNIIDEMTDDDIIYMLTQTNAYSRNVHKNLLEKGKNKKDVAASIRTALKTVPALGAPIILNSTNDTQSQFAEGGEVEPNKYRIVTKDPTLKSQIQSAVDWTNKWHAARKATGKFDDQYKSTEPYSSRPVAILPSNIGDAAGTFTGSQKSSLVRVNPDVAPQWGNSLESAVVHELGHETSIENAAAKMSADRAKSSAIVKKVSEITGSPEFHTTEQGSDYYNTAAEEYARLQQMRHAMNADPTKEYSLPELKSWLKQYQLPADERGVRLMNDVAMVDFNPDGILMLNEGGVIKIKEKNKGKFTESAKRAGMGVLEFAKHVLANKDDYSSTQVKRANFARNATKWKHAEGTDQVKPNRYSERPIVDYNPITGETVYGYNPGAGFLSAEDPIASDVMMGITGVRITPMLRKLFPHYGGTFGAMMFGDSGKSTDRDNENMLIIPNSNTKLDRPISTNVLNTDLRRYYADDVLPRDVLTSDYDKLLFLNTDKNFQYDLYPLSHFNPGVAGYFNHKDNKIRLNNQYSDNKDLLDNIMAHEVNHRYNSEFPLDKKHNRILNNAYTVESDLNTPIARAARRGSEKRATNVNIRHRLQTDLRNRLGRVPTKTEMDKFIDSLSDKELLDRLGHSNAYGAAYLLSIEDRADLVNQPVDQYKKQE